MTGIVGAARRAGGFALRIVWPLVPLLVFLAGVRFSGYDGRIEWQMPAVAVVVVDRDGRLAGGSCGPSHGMKVDL